MSETQTEVRNLKQLLQYQEKSVVSRMLVKNPAGSVTLFAFDSGEGLSEHTAPFDALVQGGALQIAGQGFSERPAAAQVRIGHRSSSGRMLLTLPDGAMIDCPTSRWRQPRMLPSASRAASMRWWNSGR